MKIRVITPSIRNDWYDSTLAVYQSFASSGTELSLVFLDHGPETIESDYDVILAGPDILSQVRKAENDGMDAIILDCMFDPVFLAGREISNIPLIGPAQASMTLAATLADRFSIITILDRDRPIFHNQWRQYDLQGRGASIRSINVSVLDLHEGGRTVTEAMIEQSILAITKDGAEALVFGCTGLGGLSSLVRDGLQRAGYSGVPVIDPTGVALRWAEMMAGLGLCHSKRTSPLPRKKIIKGYEDLGLSQDYPFG